MALRPVGGPTSDDGESVTEGKAEEQIALTVGIATRDRRELCFGRSSPSSTSSVRTTSSSSSIPAPPTTRTTRSKRGWRKAGKGRLPDGRLLLDEGRGVSKARNTLLREARRPFVCFLDDDARAEPGWVDASRSAWRDANERTAAIGGPIPAEWGAPRPGWLRDHLLFILSILDLGGKRLSSTSSRDAGTCGGGNMSVRVDVVRELGGFDTQFGSRPESPMDRGEDQDLQRRLAAVGYETWYEPSMVAHHYVPPERLTEAYFEAQLRTRAKAEAREAGGPARVRPLRALGDPVRALLGGRPGVTAHARPTRAHVRLERDSGPRQGDLAGQPWRGARRRGGLPRSRGVGGCPRRGVVAA